MSDEQKEYEAVKLVNMIDKLQRYDNIFTVSIQKKYINSKKL